MSFSALTVGAFATPPGRRNNGLFWARITFLGEEQLLSRRQVSSCLYLYSPQEAALIMNQKCRQLPGAAPKQHQGSQQVAVGARTHDGCSQRPLILFLPLPTTK